MQRTTQLFLRTNPILEQKSREASPAFAYTLKLPPKQQFLKMYRQEKAREALGDLTKGLERYVVSKGQFSFIEILTAVFEQTGPVDLVVSTWTAAGADMAELRTFQDHGLLTSCRFLVDISFFYRKNAKAAGGQMRELFEAEQIRISANHSKFAIVTNEAWKLTILTSANLNTNRRIEYFLIRESLELAAFNLAWINHIFKHRRPQDIDARRSEKYHRRLFDGD